MLNKYQMLTYKVRHYIFKWTSDDDGDITLSIMGCIHITKYKEHPIISFGKQPSFIKAGRYQGSAHFTKEY